MSVGRMNDSLNKDMINKNPSHNPGDGEDRGYSNFHEAACERGERSYIDPTTGYTVFTKLYHLDRGSCCGNGCRHCPWREVS